MITRLNIKCNEIKLFNGPLTSHAILISCFSILSDNFDLGPLHFPLILMCHFTTVKHTHFTSHSNRIRNCEIEVSTCFSATLNGCLCAVSHWHTTVRSRHKVSLATPLLREHVCTIIRAGWCHQRAQSPAALLSMRNWKMLTLGLSLILLNCMEGIIVILRLSGKAGTLIFPSYMAGELVCHLWERKTLFYWWIWLGICCRALW